MTDDEAITTAALMGGVLRRHEQAFKIKGKLTTIVRWRFVHPIHGGWTQLNKSWSDTERMAARRFLSHMAGVMNNGQDLA